MPAQIEVATASRPTRPLLYLGGFFAGGLGLSMLYATTGIGLGCPFRMVTGWDCPLCGGTRLGSALLRGDLALAWAYNPLVLIGLVLLAGLGAIWTFNWLGGPRVRLPQVLAERLGAMHPTRWLLLGLAVSVGYTLARNLF